MVPPPRTTDGVRRGRRGQGILPGAWGIQTALDDDSSHQWASTMAVEAGASTLEAGATEALAGGRAGQAGGVAGPNDALQDSSVGVSISCRRQRLQPPAGSVGESEADRAELQAEDIANTSSRQISVVKRLDDDSDDDGHSSGHLYYTNLNCVQGPEEKEDEDDAAKEEDASVDGSEAENDEEEGEADVESSKVNDFASIDESMSTWRRRRTLPDIRYEPRKPVALGMALGVAVGNEHTTRRHRRRRRRRVRPSGDGLE